MSPGPSSLPASGPSALTSLHQARRLRLGWARCHSGRLLLVIPSRGGDDRAGRFPLLDCQGRQGGAGLSGGARSRGKDAGARRARASGGHERSCSAWHRLDRQANNPPPKTSNQEAGPISHSRRNSHCCGYHRLASVISPERCRPLSSQRVPSKRQPGAQGGAVSVGVPCSQTTASWRASRSASAAPSGVVLTRA